jgi:hypothetical protein
MPAAGVIALPSVAVIPLNFTEPSPASVNKSTVDAANVPVNTNDDVLVASAAVVNLLIN